ncbi:hypothetical protein B0J18DRAFT_414615 [Chaetomium sp. MPI-SDFR-AT-0129]|nr:hypothetical protein B0J18DRAFT_414615 [Chaetomium sp. MPI-SDFR-AT-0129]
MNPHVSSWLFPLSVLSRLRANQVAQSNTSSAPFLPNWESLRAWSGAGQAPKTPLPEPSQPVKACRLPRSMPCNGVWRSRSQCPVLLFVTGHWLFPNRGPKHFDVVRPVRFETVPRGIWEWKQGEGLICGRRVCQSVGLGTVVKW